MAEPPLELAVQVTVACGVEPKAMPPTFVADTPVGTLGRVAGVMLDVDPLARLLPDPLVATTENVYAVPAVRPEVTVQVVADAPAIVQVPPAGLEVTV